MADYLIVYNVQSYGATGNGTTDDTTAIQNATNAAVATGGIVFFPPGTYLISSTITVTATGTAYNNATVAFLGVGYQAARFLSGDTPVPSYNSVIQCNSTSIGFLSVTTNQPIFVQQLQVNYTSEPVSGTAAITINAAAGGTSPYVNAYSLIRDVCIVGAYTGINVLNSATIHIDHVICLGCYGTSLSLSCDNSPDTGDSDVTGCVFTGGALYQVFITSMGGVRFTNNKINGGNCGIFVSPSLSSTEAGPSPLLITNNSIENTTYGILFQRSTGTENASVIIISSNEINASTTGGTASYGIEVQASGSTAWVNGLSITSNAILASSGGTCIALNGVSIVNVVGNTLMSGDGSSVSGLVWGSIVSHNSSSSNLLGPNVSG
jgi:hypothetical protein